MKLAFNNNKKDKNKVGLYRPVPTFGLPKVNVVDGIKIHIFRVPSERRLPHPKVEVSRVDTINADLVVLVDVVEYRTELVDVPLFHTWVGERTRNACTVDLYCSSD